MHRRLNITLPEETIRSSIVWPGKASAADEEAWQNREK